MKRLLSVLLLLPLAAGAAEPDKPGPNTLSPKEFTSGWLLLFDGESTYGWHSPNGSKWTVYKGMLAPQAGKPGLLVTTTAFGDYELSFEYQKRPSGKVQVLLGCDAEGKADKASAVELMYLGGGWCRGEVTFRGGVLQATTFRGPGSGVASAGRPTGPGSSRSVGHLALSGNGVIFRNVKLRPLGTKLIFNGKDLTGWKVFEGKGKRSKFTVTKEGWLNVKEGPGDIQTTGQWADFVLQLECFSNGEHLNSGVFFRCVPGEYQQGYECQVRNQFTEKPTQTYTIDEYDPRTHKLVGKRKVKSTAVDYGTGGIYRRMPARRGLAKDREWFTLTVVARGRHIATWVNGIQVCDWTDNRPASANGRNGYRAEKGPFSLQGHDPTTDLSFRNLRVADLSPGKPEAPPPKK